ncbi:MAG: hypothetical protein SGI74_02965 [Oligoflexia bacterium]|nr:hypothetical protein [Oligoflexia bacterium]
MTNLNIFDWTASISENLRRTIDKNPKKNVELTVILEVPCLHGLHDAKDFREHFFEIKTNNDLWKTQVFNLEVLSYNFVPDENDTSKIPSGVLFIKVKGSVKNIFKAVKEVRFLDDEEGHPRRFAISKASMDSEILTLNS